ncbi:baseplate J/gp47 family protein [Sorangium sp. So ce1000]|uniref:baseplate J/gp47 family protein n=1 Tax=Sorangium sp. So ce1000 TaxID=3133325 RepID=UPI003F5F53C4
MAITVEEAQQVQDATTIEAESLADLEAEGVDEVGYGDRSVARTLVTLEARARARQQEITSSVVRVGFGDLVAQNGPEWVDQFVKGKYGIDRDHATKTLWRCTVTCAAAPAGPYPGITSGLMVVSTDAGVEFENADRFDLASGETRSELFRARLAGLTGNINPGDITRLVTSYPGVTVTNVTMLRPGRDAEGNEAYIARGRSRLSGTSAGGGSGSYVRWVDEAFAAAGVEKTITSVRIDDANPFGPGSVAVYLANAVGGATAEELAIVTPYLEARHFTGSGRLVVAASPTRVINVPGIVYVTGNASVLAQISLVLAALQVELQGSAVVYRAEIIQRVMGVPGVYNYDPGGLADTLLAPGEVPVFTNSITVG